VGGPNLHLKGGVVGGLLLEAIRAFLARKLDCWPLTFLLHNVLPGDYIPTPTECEGLLQVVGYIENGSQALRIDPAFQASVKKILRSRS
jgi:hypothetical protein